MALDEIDHQAPTGFAAIELEELQETVRHTVHDLQLMRQASLLERRGMQVLTATTGREAIDTLSTTDVSIVLMDIMMPEMDGYETTQKIGREHKNSTLPIIAVTAKAMKGDRQKCIEAGASDYITKPLKIDQLLSLMRLWFYK